MLSKSKKRYLELAAKMAENSLLRHRHGAIVVKSGRVVGRGYNVRKNHPSVIADGRQPIECGYHAEIAAIKDAGKQAKGALLFVARVNKNGQPLLSKPCKRCQDEINKQGVKNVYWTQDHRS